MKTIAFRPDEETERALEILTRGGSSNSAAIRSAVIQAARRQANEELLAESCAVANDEADRQEARRVLADMEDLRAW
ncbi:MAG: hypothetical protein WCP28_22225 [Actinomycetes bacterium]